jgi:hypothetical protein
VRREEDPFLPTLQHGIPSCSGVRVLGGEVAGREGGGKKGRKKYKGVIKWKGTIEGDEIERKFFLIFKKHVFFYTSPSPPSLPPSLPRSIPPSLVPCGI